MISNSDLFLIFLGFILLVIFGTWFLVGTAREIMDGVDNLSIKKQQTVKWGAFILMKLFGR